MTIRSRLYSCLVVLMMGLALGVGCATSGDGGTTAPGCTDPQISCNGACVDPTSDNANCGACGTACAAGLACNAGACGKCVAPQTDCSGACVVLGTDNKNCGKCGASCGTNQVCSAGVCGTHCGTGLTTCGGSVDAGARDATSDAPSDATMMSDATNDATTSDAAPTDAAGPDAARDSGTTDAGGGPLYCADTQTDPVNCGGCGVSCGPGHACKMGSCQLDCPTGKHACNASNLCIPDGTCCTSADCTVTGQACSGPGDMCKCGSGKKVCTANNSCIDSAACCTTADCAGVAGSTCSMPGGTCSCPIAGQKLCPAAGACIDSAKCCGNADCPVMGEACNGVGPGVGGTCACPAGQTICPASNSCIPLTSCCTSADCVAAGGTHVGSSNCGGGVCSVATCAAGYVDVNRTYTDGCECADSGNAGSCGGATALGTVALGATITKPGNLPLVGQENWFQVTFANQSATTYHPMIALSTNPGGAYRFDVRNGCGGAALACVVESTQSLSLTSWEELTNGGDPTGITFAPTPPVGSGGSVWVRVFRASGGATCDTFVLTISN